MRTLDWLTARARQRAVSGLRRTLTPRQPADPLIDVAANDYLGLSRHPLVVEAGIGALRAWGAGATGSRLVTGNTQAHAQLEAELSDFLETESTLVFSSGYLANLAVITALADADTLVVSDSRNHASLIDGCRLATARVVVTPHRDVAAVETAVRTRPEPRALVVTDAVFSVDGDLAPLDQLHAVCERHDAMLLVDEAHAVGVVGPGGRGLAAHVAVATSPRVIRTVTLSKAIGAQGGAVIADAAVTGHLIDTARPFIFDTGLAPAAAAAAAAAIRIMRAEPERVDAVRRVAARLADIAGVEAPPAGVVSRIVGAPERAVQAAATCLAAGVRVGCFRPPSVPAGTSRLRLAARATLTDADLDRVAAALAAALATPVAP